jgi:hypothetical protein
VSSQHVFWGVFEKPIFKILNGVGGVLRLAKPAPAPILVRIPGRKKERKGKKEGPRLIRWAYQ